MKRFLSISIVRLVAIQVKRCDEDVSNQTIVNKVMCTLFSKFDYIAVVIEESKDLSVIKAEELKCSLEAHKQQVLERNKEHTT